MDPWKVGKVYTSTFGTAIGTRNYDCRNSLHDETLTHGCYDCRNSLHDETLTHTVLAWESQAMIMTRCCWGGSPRR